MLFVQNDTAGLEFACTATAFEKTPTGYLFVTAGHCTEDGDKDTAYFISFDPAAKDKPYIPAKLFLQGRDDLAVLEVKTTEEFATVPLGDQTKLHAGSPIFNVASPQGLGKLSFFGYVSTLQQEAHTREDGVDHPRMLVQMAAAPGSSGSAIFDEQSGTIVGVLIAVYKSKFGGIVVTAVTPVSCVTEELADFRLHGEKYKKELKFDIF